MEINYTIAGISDVLIEKSVTVSLRLQIFTGPMQTETTNERLYFYP